MNQQLIEKLSRRGHEEAAFLRNLELDVLRNADNEDFTIRNSRVRRGGRDITMRIHTRFKPFPLHKHDFVEMMTVVSGAISHEVNGKRVDLGVGDILLMNKHASHSVYKTGENDIGINFIISDAFLGAVAPNLLDTVFNAFLRENAKRDGEAAYLHFGAGGHRQIENLLENLMFELVGESCDHTVLTETVTLHLRYLSLGREELLCDGGKAIGKAARRRLEISTYISGNYRNATLGELSERLFITTPYLSKMIGELFGKSFKELLLEERMHRACELIDKTDMPISAIAKSVGYENESYFHRAFRSKYGTTPLNMRRQLKADFVDGTNTEKSP